MAVGQVILCSVLLAVVESEYSPVLNWDVCSPSRIVVTLTGGADGGIIYIRGYSSACKQDTTSTETVHEFEFETCGIAKAETYFTIIVQKNPLYQTGGDLQESLLCIYDLSDITVGNSLNTGDKTDDYGVNITVKPAATMKPYKDGIDVGGGDVKLIDQIIMTIQLDDEYIQDFDIKAKSCTANYLDIIKDFCSTDTDLFPNFVHVTQGVVTSTFLAFRTTDLGGGYVKMVFTCTVEVCRGSCTQEVCVNEGSSGRKRRAVRDDNAFEELNVGSSMSVGSEIDLTPTEDDVNDSVCIANVAFIAGLLVMLAILVTSMSMTTIATGKLLKRSAQLRKLADNHDVSQLEQKPKPPMERRPSVSVMNTRTETVTVKTTQSDNSKSGINHHTSGNDEINFNPTKRNTLKSQSSVSVMYNPSKLYHAGNNTINNATNKCGNQIAKKTGDDVSISTPSHLETIPEVNSISEEELTQLKQCRAMLKLIGMKN